MADIFLNSTNFASHAFLTSAPPSGYALNLKILIKVSKVSWTSQLLNELLRSSFERKFDKINFVSPKKTPPKSPQFLGLRARQMQNSSTLMRSLDVVCWTPWFFLTYFLANRRCVLLSSALSQITVKGKTNAELIMKAFCTEEGGRLEIKKMMAH